MLAYKGAKVESQDQIHPCVLSIFKFLFGEAVAKE